jgi:serine/threonine-protein kinase RsbW
MVNNTIYYSIESDLSQVRELAVVFHEFSSGVDLGDELSGQLELMLVEAINNVIEHAYENKQGFPIDVEFEASYKKVVITIKDKGLSFPDHVISDQQQDMPENTDLPEGGWGLGLISILADQMRHYTKNGINIMVLTKYREPLKPLSF